MNNRTEGSGISRRRASLRLIRINTSKTRAPLITSTQTTTRRSLKEQEKRPAVTSCTTMACESFQGAIRGQAQWPQPYRAYPRSCFEAYPRTSEPSFATLRLRRSRRLSFDRTDFRRRLEPGPWRLGLGSSYHRLPGLCSLRLSRLNSWRCLSLDAHPSNSPLSFFCSTKPHSRFVISCSASRSLTLCRR